MADVHLQQISKRFGDVEVIPALDLEIPDGSFTVLVGPSGCGKSTLLRIVSGLEPPSSGSVRIGGRDVTRDEPSKRGISMVFQSYALYPHMTVRQNIDFGLRLARTPKAEREERVLQAARTLHLEPLLERRPVELSGGQRQRVAIGRSIVRKPGVFLFDEPLSNLDAVLRTEMRIELAQLHERFAATMVYVTHDQVEAMTLADRIVVMNGGRIEQVGAPMELYERPGTEFVAGFIGSPRMNLLPGRAVGRDDAARVGIRPEHLDLDERTGAWGAEVLVVEHLGSDTVAYVKSDDFGSLAVRISGHRRLAPHARVRLEPRPGHLHLFDGDGARLPGSDG